jgi:ribosome biogenesis GTPase
MPLLSQLGWRDKQQSDFAALQLDNCVPGRVVTDHGSLLLVATPTEVLAEVSGKLSHTLTPAERPRIGDWVAVQILDNAKGIIHGILPRRSVLSRQASGKASEQQVIAANIDKAFIVQAATDDLSRNRLDRYLFQIASANIEPFIVINKIDLSADLEGLKSQLGDYSNLIFASQETGDGVPEIIAAISAGETAVLLGSSGVGKSTIINSLLQRSAQATAEVRESDSKGRHTTTHKQLFEIPGGGLIIDTPGVRELQLWGESEDLATTFPDILELALSCKFSDCKHQSEPGCNVRSAVNKGKITSERLDNYFKLLRELEHLANKTASAAKKK